MRIKLFQFAVSIHHLLISVIWVFNQGYVKTFYKKNGQLIMYISLHIKTETINYMQFVVSNCCYFFYLVLDWARKIQSFMTGSAGIALSFINL